MPVTRAALFLAALLLAPLATADRAAQAQQVPNPMARDGSNAAPQVQLPALGLNGGSLTAISPVTLAVEGSAQTGMARFLYGRAGAPLAVDGAFGYHGLNIEVFGNPGVGSATPFTAGLYSKSHLSAGSNGIAVGAVGHGYTEGTWATGGAFNAGAVGLWGQAESTRGGTVFGVAAACNQTVTAGGSMACIEIDTNATADVAAKYGLAINAAAQDTGAVTNAMFVNGSGAAVASGSAILVQGLAAGAYYPHVLLTVQQQGAGYHPPVPPAGSLWRSGGFTVAGGLNWADMTFSGNAIDVGAGKVKAGGIVATALPANCTGQPAGTLWNDAATVKVCP